MEFRSGWDMDLVLYSVLLSWVTGIRLEGLMPELPFTSCHCFAMSRDVISR